LELLQLELEKTFITGEEKMIPLQEMNGLVVDLQLGAEKESLLLMEVLRLNLISKVMMI